MKNAIVRIFPRAVRVAAVASISFVALLFAACNMNTPLTGAQDAAARQAVSAPAVTSAAIPPLGSASTFAVMGYAGVTNSGASQIVGDMGAGLGAIAVTGFSTSGNTFSGPGTHTDGLGIVDGTIYLGGDVAKQAHIDAVIAYNSLVAQVPGKTFSGVTELDGMTFTPGVYKFAPAAGLKVNGNVYLDFGGNPNAVFIFQMGSELKTEAGSNVIALNTGSQPPDPPNPTPNVYWAVGSSATINGATFIGTVIATTAITMTSAGNVPATTIVAGRMFALGASVTMVDSMISIVAGGSGGTNPPPVAVVCKDFVTGGGWIDGNSDKWGRRCRWNNNPATFGVSGGIMNGKFWGQLSYNDHGKNGVKVKSTSVTNYFIIDATTREIDGVARVNGHDGVTFKVIVSDKGERGRHDTFSIELSNGYSYSASGTLTGGNIQLHLDCAVAKDHHDRYHHDRENYKDKDEEDGHSYCDR